MLHVHGVGIGPQDETETDGKFNVNEIEFNVNEMMCVTTDTSKGLVQSNQPG